MHEALRRSSHWLLCGSLLLFVLSWSLRINSHGEGLFFGWVLVWAPFGAFVACVQFLFEGFDPSTLLWACVFSLVTLLNGFVFFGVPFVRSVLKERSGLISLILGLAIVTLVVLFEVGAGWSNPFQLGFGPLAWIASFALMSASCAASHFAQSSISSSKSVSDHD